jgi:hypothetical protein
VFWWGNLRERAHLEDPGINGKIILVLKGNSTKCNGGAWNGLIWLRIGTGGGYFSVSITRGEFLD